MLITLSADCPYCGEPNELEVDPSAGKKQTYTEDCQVCCRPWVVKVKMDQDGEANVNLYAEDESANED